MNANLDVNSLIFGALKVDQSGLIIATEYFVLQDQAGKHVNSKDVSEPDSRSEDQIAEDSIELHHS